MNELKRLKGLVSLYEQWILIYGKRDIRPNPFEYYVQRYIKYNRLLMVAERVHR